MLIAALLCAGFAGGGCAGDAPRSRLGALPFHGPFTLYKTADPDDLGRHRYGQAPRFFQADEKERGILYTTRAGFLDLAHVRITTDWTRYYAEQVRRALAAGDESVVLPGMDHARVHVRLNYPPGWADMDEAFRDVLTRELSIRTGQRLAYLTLTWHEVATWFGNRSVFFVDESPSAFTWDDTMSHVIGLRVAERALRDGVRGYDDAVTAALAEELRELGAVTPEETDEAVRAVEGAWWRDGKPLKRQFDVGLRQFVVYPWLVRGPAFCEAVDPEPFHLPTIEDVLGYDLSNFYTAEIEPHGGGPARAMRQHVPGHPRRFEQGRDLFSLLQAVSAQMRQQFGPKVNQPWPAAPAAASLADMD